MKIKLYILFFLFIAFFNLNCSKNLVEIKKKKDKNQISKIILQLKSKNWEKRVGEIGKFSKYYVRKNNRKIIEPYLIDLTYDIHPIVVIEALKVLSIASSPKVLNRIMEIAGNSKNNNIRWYALKVLSKFRDPVSISIFIKGLKNEDWIIREVSIKGLLLISKKNQNRFIVPSIVKAINDESRSVQLAVFNNIKLKDKRIYKEIIKFLNNKKYYQERTLVIALLKAIKGYRLDSKTKNNIISMLTSRNKKIRIYALRVLKEDNKISKENLE
jgi:HEAT repeat protein